MSVRKPPDERQRTNTPDAGPIEAPPEPTTIPPPRREWMARTKADWRQFWTSPARQIVVSTLDHDVVTRLFGLRDEHERAYQALRAPQRDKDGKAIRGSSSRLVIGSTGQTRPNGLYAVMARLESEIRQLEMLFGKSPKARLNLGMVIGDGAPTESDEDETDEPANGSGTVPPDPGLYLVAPVDGSAGRVPTTEVREPGSATG